MGFMVAPVLTGMGVSAATAATISTVATVASTALSFVGALSSANAQSQAAKYQAAVARNNSIIAEQNAQAERQKGIVDEQTARMKTAQMIGSEKAAMGANGLAIEKGTNLDVQSSAAELGELNALTIRDNAARKAYGYETQSTNFQAEAGLQDQTAKNATTAGWLNAGTDLVAGASSVSNKWAIYKQAGIPGYN